MHMGVDLTNAGAISTAKQMSATAIETQAVDVSVSLLVVTNFSKLC